MKLVPTVAVSQTLSIVAAEEASRFGVHTVDLEHVLLALVIDERTAGRVLRELGVTLAATRAAVRDEHHARLASLGIDAELPEAGPIRFHSTGGYELTDRALFLVSRAAARGDGDTAEILRALVTEPSGTVDGILTRLGVPVGTVLDALDAAATPSPAARTGDRLTISRTVFVPAPLDQVWRLVSDPLRLPAWDAGLATVETIDDGWLARTRTVAPDGRRLRGADGHELLVDRTALAEPSRVTWRFTSPTATTNPRTVEVALAGANSGADVTLTLAWTRAHQPGPVAWPVAILVRAAMRPLLRLSLWNQVTALTGGISRACRA